MEEPRFFLMIRPTGHSTIRATQAVRITVRPARVLVCILDKIYIIY